MLLYQWERGELFGRSLHRAAPVRPLRVELTRNYRSHEGILETANVVYSLLSDRFPLAVDKMKAETGVSDLDEHSQRLAVNCFICLVLITVHILSLCFLSLYTTSPRPTHVRLTVCNY